MIYFFIFLDDALVSFIRSLDAKTTPEEFKKTCEEFYTNLKFNKCPNPSLNSFREIIEEAFNVRNYSIKKLNSIGKYGRD